jgi:PAS domain S-box-containing protein
VNDPLQRYPKMPTWAKYLLATAIFAVMLGIRLAFLPVEVGMLYLTFLPGLAIAALLCGIGPALLFLALAVGVSSYIFYPPHWETKELSSHLPLTVGFIVASLIILGILVFFQRQSERRARSLRSEISERRRFESQSAENSARLKAVFDTAFDAIISVDVEQRIILFNSAAEKTFGYSAAEVIGTLVGRLIPESFREKHAVHMRAFSARGEGTRRMSPSGYVTGLRSDGSEFPVEASISMTVVDGKPLLTVILRDVSERRQAELALSTSRQQLKAFVEQAPVSIAMLNGDLDYLATSRRWLVEYGHGNANLTGCNLYAINPDVLEDWKEAHRKALAGVPSSNDQDLWVRNDGSRNWLRWAIYPWYSEAGIIGGIVIYVEDITRQKFAEDALVASENDLNRAQAVGNIGSWRLDVRRNELFWSAENYRIFGVAEGTPMTYETFLSRVHPEDRSYVDAMWTAALTGKPYDIEHRLLVDGQIKWVKEKAELEFDAAGGVLGGFGITQDITGKRLVENQLKEALDRLAEVADERAVHLRVLSEELTRAEQIERDRLYQLLHDHVQPLLVAARLKLSRLDEHAPQQDVLRNVAEANKHISELISIARSLTVELNPPLIMEQGLIAALEPLCWQIHKNHALNVQMDCATDAEPRSMTVRLLCFNAIRELLMNVVKYSGDIEATLDLRRESHNTLRITVRDNGAGFDMSRPHSGSGLSNLSRRLSMVGGSLSLESSPGKGTTATLLAPIDMRDGATAGSLIRRPWPRPGRAIDDSVDVAKRPDNTVSGTPE